MTCPDCGTGNDPRRTTCGWCGRPLVEGARAVDGEAPAGSVPSDWYDEEYYLTWCGGGDAEGRLSPPLERAWALAGVEPGMRVLDVGCGRGEVLARARAAGARAHGVDSSVAAIRIARARLEADAGLVRADARTLPFAGESFDRVLLSDVVEHLHPPELAAALAEVRRVLVPGGRLVVHTMPNVWYLRLGYPATRWLQALRLHERLPVEPRSVHARRLHVNEQDPARLARALREARLPARILVEKFADRPGRPFEFEPGSAADLYRRAVERLRLAPGVLWLRDLLFYRAWPLAWIFCNDLYAVATKVES